LKIKLLEKSIYFNHITSNVYSILTHTTAMTNPTSLPTSPHEPDFSTPKMSTAAKLARRAAARDQRTKASTRNSRRSSTRNGSRGSSTRRRENYNGYKSVQWSAILGRACHWCSWNLVAHVDSVQYKFLFYTIPYLLYLLPYIIIY